MRHERGAGSPSKDSICFAIFFEMLSLAWDFSAPVPVVAAERNTRRNCASLCCCAVIEPAGGFSRGGMAPCDANAELKLGKVSPEPPRSLTQHSCSSPPDNAND